MFRLFRSLYLRFLLIILIIIYFSLIIRLLTLPHCSENRAVEITKRVSVVLQDMLDTLLSAALHSVVPELPCLPEMTPRLPLTS